MATSPVPDIHLGERGEWEGGKESLDHCWLQDPEALPLREWDLIPASNLREWDLIPVSNLRRWDLIPASNLQLQGVRAESQGALG